MLPLSTTDFTEPTALLRYSKSGVLQVGWRVYRQDIHGYVHSTDIEWRDVERES